MTKPRARRPRRSFGGKDGVWWRKKTLPPLTTSSETDSPPSNVAGIGDSEIPSTSNDKQTEIGWDDDLCRPIYHRNNVVSDEFHDDSSEDDGSSEDKEKPAVVSKEAAPIVPAKRKNTYGGKGPRPLSLLLLESNLEYGSASPIASPDKKKSRTESPSYSRTSLFPFTDSGSPSSSPVSDLLLPRRVSTSPGGPKPLEEEEKTKTTEDSPITDSSSQDAPRTTTPFDFAGDEVTLKSTLTKDPERITANSSILKAQEYFRHLDATEKLKLDSSDSPVVSSKVVRTSRNVCLHSPGLTREYEAYSKSIAETGLTPLSVKDYARGRSDFFRKGELFDGFLDD